MTGRVPGRGVLQLCSAGELPGSEDPVGILKG